MRREQMKADLLYKREMMMMMMMGERRIYMRERDRGGRRYMRGGGEMRDREGRRDERNRDRVGEGKKRGTIARELGRARKDRERERKSE